MGCVLHPASILVLCHWAAPTLTVGVFLGSSLTEGTCPLAQKPYVHTHMHSVHTHIIHRLASRLQLCAGS